MTSKEIYMAEVRASRKDEIGRCLDKEASQYMKSSYEELIAAAKDMNCIVVQL